MPRRRVRPVRGMPAPIGRGWLVLLMGPTSTYPIELQPGSTSLPSGAELTREGDRIHLQAARGGASVNDVEVHGPTALNSGDVFKDGGFEYLLLPAPTVVEPRATAVLEHREWRNRVEEEVSAGTAPFTILIGRSGAFEPPFLEGIAVDLGRAQGSRVVLGGFGRSSLEALVLGDPARVDALRQTISDRAAREEETVRWGVASFPLHGATAEEVWSAAVDRMLGLNTSDSVEPVWQDHYMARLYALAERWAGRQGLALIGSEGVGRETLARVVRRAAAAEAPFISHSCARFDRARWSEDVAKAAGGALHLRRPAILPEDELRAFWSASSFRPSIGVVPGVDLAGLPENRIVIPDLRDRPADVVPISEKILHEVDAHLSRRRSNLRADTRARLQQLPVAENVRSLRNAVIRGALEVTGAEVWPQHLDASHPPSPGPGMRAKVRETERREIEAALVGSGWNVTEAARRMELPRRTLVYKIHRYGLRRPGRHE